MFGTLRYAPENKAGEFLERESGVVGNAPANKPQHSACDNCRVKKIRCSGRRAGCARCKTLSLPCSYNHIPAWKSKKPAPSSNRTNHSKDSAALCRSPAMEDAATAAVQPSVLTMEPLPHGVDQNYIGLDKAMQQAQGVSESVLDWTLKDISTWSSCLDWSPGREGTSMPDPDYLVTENLRLPAGPFSAGSPRSGDIIHPPPPPPIAHGFIPPDLLPTPSEDTPEIAMEAQSSCSCLYSAVFLLDKLETPHHDGDPGAQGLDSILSIYQEVLLLCKRMIHCKTCRQKSENMMVLTMVLERLAILCGEVIDAFIAQREATHVSVAIMEKQPLLLGGYEVEAGDYEVMMGMLVTRRLSGLESLLARMKMFSSTTAALINRPEWRALINILRTCFESSLPCALWSPNGGRSKSASGHTCCLEKHLRTKDSK